jgi:hypothetical protein
MRNDTLERLIWILIYGGLLVAGLGWAVGSQAPTARVLLVVGGGAAVAVGVVLIWVRSRRDG